MDTIAPQGPATPTRTPVRLAGSGTTHLVTLERPALYVHPVISATSWERFCQ